MCPLANVRHNNLIMQEKKLIFFYNAVIPKKTPVCLSANRCLLFLKRNEKLDHLSVCMAEGLCKFIVEAFVHDVAAVVELQVEVVVAGAVEVEDHLFMV